MGDHVEEEALNSNLSPKLEFIMKTPLGNVLNHLLENTWIEFLFPYDSLPYHKGAKWDTIVGTRKIIVKLPHCRGLALTYPMENKMPLICQVVEW